MRSSTGVLPPRSIPAPATRSRSSRRSRSGRCGGRQTLDLDEPKIMPLALNVLKLAW